MRATIPEIKQCIEKKIDEGFRKFIIFPFGEIGMHIKNILNNVYGIQEEYILDNHLCKYNAQIKTLAFLDNVDCKNYCVILATENRGYYGSMKQSLRKYFEEENIAELPSMMETGGTRIGRYSYGPICRNHPYIESIGSFSSFAIGTDVVMNHEMKYLTTHPMLYYGPNLLPPREYCEFRGNDSYFDGVSPHKEKVESVKRITIGNDVWLGMNVIITNYANIGNGVIAGAGSVITRDVPDYAVVAGVPARIIRYRYEKTRIEALNQIAWWDWTDDEIRERYDDFYLPIDDFIKKYL